MKIVFLNCLLICTLLLSASFPVQAQSAFAKIADDTFMFIKAGTFAKPGVSKNTNKLALAQVRVHYKFITTEMNMSKGTSARVTAYLESDVTEKDLQMLTEEFYQNLQSKLGSLGIEFVGWDKIQATEYYKDRMTVTEENKRMNGDVKNGQGWLSITANGGPVFLRFNPTDATMEIVGYGKQKKIRKFCEEIEAPMATLDAVVDFAGIEIGVNSGSSSKYIYGGGVKTTSYRRANWSVVPAMMVNMGNASFFDEKMKYDGYAVKVPIVSSEYFSPEPYEDERKAALTTQRFFGTSITATPVVIETKRDLYLAAARNALNLYSELFVEKLRNIRAGGKS